MPDDTYSPIIVSEYQANLLMKSRKCSRGQALLALEIRDGILELAEEYIDRKDIAKAMSQEERYPKYAQYQEQTRRV